MRKTKVGEIKLFGVICTSTQLDAVRENGDTLDSVETGFERLYSVDCIVLLMICLPVEMLSSVERML